MKCPRCGVFQLADATDCSNCGMIFARYRPGGLDRSTYGGNQHIPKNESGMKWVLGAVLVAAAAASFITWRIATRPERAAAAGPTMTLPKGLDAKVLADKIRPIDPKLADQLERGEVTPEMVGMLMRTLKKAEQSAGASESEEESSLASEQWTISGRVLDVVRLTPIAGARVLFISGGRSAVLTSDSFGALAGEIPVLESGQYVIEVIPPADYNDTVLLGKDGSFGFMEYKERLRLNRQFAPIAMVSGEQSGLEIGLYPRTLSSEETATETTEPGEGSQ